MQPAKNSAHPAEDIHAILSRFQTWAGKQPENGHRQNAAGVREIPMEEAMRQLRSRRAKPAAPMAEKPPAPQPPTVPGARDSKAASAPKRTPPTEAVATVSEKTAAAVSAPEDKTGATADDPARKVRALIPQGARAARLAAAARRKPLEQKRITTPALAAAERPRRTAAKPASARKPKKRAVSAAVPMGGGPQETGKRQARKADQPARPSVRRRAARATRKAEFREVLARSVRTEKAAKKQERRQRVSVRLSSTEERRLQQRALQAGLTISEYLRRSALEAEAPQQQTLRGRAGAPGRSGKAAAPLFVHSTNQNNSVLGGWIALLRNRFLASPARFAERA